VSLLFCQLKFPRSLYFDSTASIGVDTEYLTELVQDGKTSTDVSSHVPHWLNTCLQKPVDWYYHRFRLGDLHYYH
jgi:hypothetical protein